MENDLKINKPFNRTNSSLQCQLVWMLFFLNKHNFHLELEPNHQYVG